MKQTILLALAALSQWACAQDSYVNYTEANEFRDRAGWNPYFPGEGDLAPVYWRGFTTFLFANDYGLDSSDMSDYEGCDGLCAASFPFGWNFNVSEPTNSVSFSADNFTLHGFDMYSFAYGCYAFGPNGTDTNGKTTYGRVPQDCTITTTAKTIKGKQLHKSFKFKAKGIPSDLQRAAWPASFRNLTTLSWNATSVRTKKFPYAPVVAIDDVAYGAMVNYTPVSKD